jgi:hypothetical protein
MTADNQQKQLADNSLKNTKIGNNSQEINEKGLFYQKILTDRNVHPLTAQMVFVTLNDL